MTEVCKVLRGVRIDPALRARPSKYAHLDGDSRTKGTSDDVLPSFAHLSQPVQYAEDRCTRGVSVVLVHVITRAKVIRCEIE